MSGDPVRYELRDSNAILWFDDGKANALTLEKITALHAGLDRAEKEARAVVLLGRPGRFSAGFDLSVMRQGGLPVAELVAAGAELALRLYGFPRPVVIGCTGHAIAMGAILCLAADVRIGVSGDFKIGLNEVGIGMTLPHFAIEFAQARLSPQHLTRAAVEAELYSPEGAVEAGFLDTVASPDGLLPEALGEATRAGMLDATAYRNTKLRLRGSMISRTKQVIERDRNQLAGAGG